LHCSYYLPRGYNSSTWKKLPAPVLDVNAAIEDNLASMRDEEISQVIADAEKERKAGNIIIIAGDFNEASFKDWQSDTKDIRDHHGMIINWNSSMMLYQAGYVDAYRVQYPDAVKYPDSPLRLIIKMRH
jgi:exonuclease III